jgi:site-specific DNA-methyltransferase (adenine-specific)
LNVINNIEGLNVGQIAPNSIVNADCLKAMKLIPDKSVDAIICDLPYQMTALAWDKLIPFEPLWEQYKRIIKPNGAIALFGSQPFTSALVMSNPKWFKYEWIWDKKISGNPLLAKISPLKIHENILVFSKEKHNYYPVMRKGVLKIKGGDSARY